MRPGVTEVGTYEDGPRGREWRPGFGQWCMGEGRRVLGFKDMKAICLRGPHGQPGVRGRTLVPGGYLGQREGSAPTAPRPTKSLRVAFHRSRGGRVSLNSLWPSPCLLTEGTPSPGDTKSLTHDHRVNVHGRPGARPGGKTQAELLGGGEKKEGAFIHSCVHSFPHRPPHSAGTCCPFDAGTTNVRTCSWRGDTDSPWPRACRARRDVKEEGFISTWGARAGG